MSQIAIRILLLFNPSVFPSPQHYRKPIVRATPDVCSLPTFLLLAPFHSFFSSHFHVAPFFSPLANHLGDCEEERLVFQACFSLLSPFPTFSCLLSFSACSPLSSLPTLSRPLCPLDSLPCSLVFALSLTPHSPLTPSFRPSRLFAYHLFRYSFLSASLHSTCSLVDQRTRESGRNGESAEGRSLTFPLF